MSKPTGPSQIEANKVVRFLNGDPMKYTCRILRKDGTTMEIQCMKPPKIDYSHESRSLMLLGFAPSEKNDDYGPTYPICCFDDVDLIQMDLNPGKE